jgi:subtilisin family serine protease
MIRAVAALLAVCVIGCSAPVDAQTKKPKLPPGRDPGGVAIAVLSTGIDYTRPELAGRLARDGEGELIGWDFVDDDNRPYAPSPNDTPASWGGDGTRIATRLTAVTNVRLVPIRIAPSKPATLAHAIAFAAKTPARVLLVPMGNDQANAWESFRLAAAKHPDLLIVTAAGGWSGGTFFPAAFKLDNLLVVTARPENDEPFTLQNQSADVWLLTSHARLPDPVAAADIIVATLDAMMSCSSVPAVASAGGRKLRRLLALLATSKPSPARQPDPICALQLRLE